MKRPRASRSTLASALGILAALLLGGDPAHGVCKLDTQQCQTNSSCCGGLCKKPTVQRGKAVFGTCCTPTTCAAQGKNCGAIANGSCGDMLSCGACTAPQTCGGSGTANVCGCTPTTCAAQGASCGTISNGCGGTLDCGPCPTFTPTPTPPPATSTPPPTPTQTPGCLALGTSCVDELDCCQDGATTCDGTCCHFVEESCASDNQCCSLSCRDGACCARPGQECTNDGNCCTEGLGACDSGVCRCLTAGEVCNASTECCDGLGCSDGTCQPLTCLPLQTACASDGNCCQSESTYCAQSCGTIPFCCRLSGGSCLQNCDCCGGQGTCTGGQCCQGEGGPCNDFLADPGCCSGLTCSGGVQGTCQFICPTGTSRCADSCCPTGQCCNGTCCANFEDCVDGKCEEICLAIKSTCDPTADECCHDAVCGLQACNQVGTHCCRPIGGACDPSHPETPCQPAGECCGNGTGCSPSGVCGGTGARCSISYNCLSGVCDFNTGLCTAAEPCTGPNCEVCLPAGEVCNLGSQRQCCSDAVCSSNGACRDGDPICCRPLGGSCTQACQCCGPAGTNCSASGVCGGPGAVCTISEHCESGQCVSGRCQ